MRLMHSRGREREKLLWTTTHKYDSARGLLTVFMHNFIHISSFFFCVRSTNQKGNYCCSIYHSVWACGHLRVCAPWGNLLIFVLSLADKHINKHSFILTFFLSYSLIRAFGEELKIKNIISTESSFMIHTCVKHLFYFFFSHSCLASLIYSWNFCWRFRFF